MKRLDPRATKAKFLETEARAAARRFRVYKNGRLMGGSADEDTARRLAAVIGGCEVRS